MKNGNPEQSLEWTYQFRQSKEYTLGCLQHFVLSFLVTLLMIPIVILGVFLTDDKQFLPHPRDLFGPGWYFGFLAVVLVICWLAHQRNKSPRRTLRINHQAIILTDTTIWGPKERRRNAAGAKFRTVYLDVLNRIFTFDMYRMNSAYHIEITRNGETFLFPCEDETQQRQILKTIGENGFGG